MKRVHEMPFGARYGDGATGFRLWAPGCESVRLELGRGSVRTVPMAREAGGWHTATVEDVKPGDAYAFRIADDGPAMPDPASRSNPWDVNAPSAVVDPRAFEWDDAAWKGRPWNEAVVYEMHVGTFTREGTYVAAIERLDYLMDLGITALELMPLADFAGTRNWGYDGVLPFAPDAAYGSVEDLKRLVSAAHRRGIMVLIDVVYNHFGPEGNYLPKYAPQFFNDAHQTPWGAAINFDGEHSRTVRDFFVHNALYWLEEFHFDGLRMDAIHSIADDSPRHIVTEIAEAIATGPGRDRHIHQVLENDLNHARLLERGRPHAVAQWNDDSHHAFHVVVTGERDGYYRDYAERPHWHLGRVLAEGFSYQGDPSPHRNGERRGEPSTGLPPEAFVNFIQNHDQVGNRAMGERIRELAKPEALRLAAAALCLAPSVPLIFMGEEFGARTPFLFFCDFGGELGQAVREGRRKEFSCFARFANPEAQARIPDPLAEETFLASKLRWEDLAKPEHAEWHRHYRSLLALRAMQIVPRLRDERARAIFKVVGGTGLAIDWDLPDGSRLRMRANFGDAPLEALDPASGDVLHAEGGATAQGPGVGPWAGIWTLEAR
ncbi:MAG TPA: malto-oligosyltrehalose trehalohydrolase [Usitatibacter sp.]|nr:malto-oligosyltrehalose trehalohydrolase [Usitatibacter sp.]